MASIRINEEKGVRYLQFGAHWIQGAMRVARPWALELEYTRDMMFALLLVKRVAWPRRVLLIGLGAGSLNKYIHRHLPQAVLEVVEIDAEVVLTAWQFFKLPPESRRLQIEIGDGFRHVAQTRSRYDLILVDGFDAKVRAGDLDSLAFYRRCRARLNPGGMIATNLVGRRARPVGSIKRLHRAFDNRLLELPRVEANTIAIAQAGARLYIGFDALRARARRLKTDTGLDLQSTVDSLARACRGSSGIEL